MIEINNKHYLNMIKWYRFIIQQMYLQVSKFNKLLLPILITLMFIIPTSAFYSDLDLNQDNDTVKPTLNIISPTQTEDYNNSFVLVKLELRDETSWSSLNISIGDQLLFIIENDGYIVNDSSTQVTLTYLYLERNISIFNQPNLQDKIFRIKGYDSADNEVVYSLNIIRDIFKPEALWVSPVEGQTFQTTEIFLEWQVIDESNIKSQLIRLDGIVVNTPITQNNGKYSTSLSLLKSNFSIQEYTVSIEIFDVFDNRDIFETQFFVLNPDIDTKLPSATELRDKILQIILWLLVFLILITLNMVFGNRIKKKIIEKDEFNPNAKWKGELTPPPLLDLMKIIISENPSMLLQLTDIFMQIETNWNERSEEFLTKDKIIIQEVIDFIDGYISDLTINLINEINLNSSIFAEIDHQLNSWKKKSIEESKKWKKTIVSPPFREILLPEVEENTDLYHKLNQVIDEYEKKWFSITESIKNTKDITINQVMRIIKDFISEILIIANKSNTLSETQISNLENQLNNWMTSLFQ